MERGITLRQIRYFEALARHRHFGKAALSCAVSQPALSLQLRELENRLGVTLVERGQGPVLLTAFGRVFLKRASLIMQDLDDLCDLARAGSGFPGGLLRLGVIPTIAPYLLPDLLRHAALRFPALRPVLREAMTATLLEDLAGGKIDAAILALPVPAAGLEELALFDEAFVLARPARDRLRPVPAPEGLAELQLLLLEDGHCFRDQALSLCRIGAGSSHEIMSASSLGTLVQLVGAGLGVTLLPEMAVPSESQGKGIDLQPFGRDQPGRRIGMVWRRNSALAAPLRQFAALVGEIGEGLRESAAVILGARGAGTGEAAAGAAEGAGACARAGDVQDLCNPVRVARKMLSE